MVVCATIGAVLMFGASASAQTSATDQYLRDGTGGSGVAGATDTGNDGSLSAGIGTSGGGGGGGTGAGGTGAGGTGAGATGATAGVTATQVLTLSFGASAPDALQTQIDAALAQAGLTPGPAGAIGPRAVEDFLGSPLARTLAAGGGAGAVGKAVAALLLHPGPQTAAVLRALLIDPMTLTMAPTQAVLTRTVPASGDSGAFLDGLVRGLDEIPRVYVELSGAKTSFVKTFAQLGVSTVDDLDKAAGRAAFTAILVNGAEGNFGTKPTADSKLTPLGVKPISAPVADTGGASLSAAMPYLLLLALVFGALVWALPGLRGSPFGPRSR
jgi:hypothetical protein